MRRSLAAPKFRESIGSRALPRVSAAENLPAVDPDGNLSPTSLPQGPLRELRFWQGILRNLGISAQEGQRIAQLAQKNGTRFGTELRVSGLCDEEEIFAQVAACLGLAYGDRVDPARLLIRDNQIELLLTAKRQRAVLHQELDQPPIQLIADDALLLEAMQARLKQSPDMAKRLRVVSRRNLRQALIMRGANPLAIKARDRLSQDHPDFTARRVLNRWQAIVLGATIFMTPIFVFFSPEIGMLLAHIIFSLFFLACVWLRFSAAREAYSPALPRLQDSIGAELPTYSVLVALYREAEIIPELLASLGRLEWPTSKLDLKLVCEADDKETLAAIRRETLAPNVEILHVPNIGPRTKPKALTYALSVSSGDVVAIYDAEDRPHPKQLLEAWQRFSREGDDLGCVQAPLIITNGRRRLLARMFAFEYAALFRGILPFLSRRNLVLPLGGTSNHFRREALEKVGAWDPFNVTEDADLGIRLMRMGYRCSTISYPTFEDAPLTTKVWVKQRTRWFKGWLQTWLVHMRDPLRLWRELGTGSFLIVQILFAGMVLSAMFHPFLLIAMFRIGTELINGGGAATTQRSLLFVVDSINMSCGYAAFLVLGSATLLRREKKRLWQVVMATPIYWLFMSFAAWRSAFQLYTNPFLWEKTPHRARKTASEERRLKRTSAQKARSPLRR